MKMRRSIKFLLIFLGLMIILLLFGIHRYGYMFNIYLKAPSPQTYGKQAIAFMNNGYFSNTPDWQKAQSEALSEIEKAKSYEDVHPVLKKIIKVAGGKHSFAVSRHDGLKERDHSKRMPVSTVKENILILTVPEIFMAEDQDRDRYISEIRHMIESKGQQGVIVNLAGNRGGNMWPMLSGLSAILPEGDLLNMVTVNGEKEPVTLEKSDKINQIKKDQETLKKLKVPVAVIIDQKTASSAEIVALAFRGLEYVKLFGEPSAGYTSVNMEKQLYDGFLLGLTIGALEDRSKKLYFNEPIQPDIFTKDPITEALNWIKEQK